MKGGFEMGRVDEANYALVSRMRIHGNQLEKLTEALGNSSSLEKIVTIQAKTIASLSNTVEGLSRENEELRAKIASYELGAKEDVQSSQQGMARGKIFPSTSTATTFTVRQPGSHLRQ